MQNAGLKPDAGAFDAFLESCIAEDNHGMPRELLLANSVRPILRARRMSWGVIMLALVTLPAVGLFFTIPGIPTRASKPASPMLSDLSSVARKVQMAPRYAFEDRD